ncbi:DUF4169 family protein [Segnochrobactraceae bacterium EtOH-i3]
MAEIINLRRARKDRARAEKEQTAADNRVRFGRTKAEKEKAALESDLASRRLEGHRRESDSPDEAAPEGPGGKA